MFLTAETVPRRRGCEAWEVKGRIFVRGGSGSWEVGWSR